VDLLKELLRFLNNLMERELRLEGRIQKLEAQQMSFQDELNQLAAKLAADQAQLAADAAAAAAATTAANAAAANAMTAAQKADAALAADAAQDQSIAVADAKGQTANDNLEALMQTLIVGGVITAPPVTPSAQVKK